ncbi:hypothetical protein TNCV_16341 [Trichonephila clavipes]|nr:hypothetical protein TNCV_16341 [Trichonephila clavipes]
MCQLDFDPSVDLSGVCVFTFSNKLFVKLYLPYNIKHIKKRSRAPQTGLSNLAIWITQSKPCPEDAEMMTAVSQSMKEVPENDEGIVLTPKISHGEGQSNPTFSILEQQGASVMDLLFLRDKAAKCSGQYRRLQDITPLFKKSSHFLQSRLFNFHYKPLYA